MEKSYTRITKIFFKPAYILLLFCILTFLGCFHALKKEISTPEKALVPVKYPFPEFSDDMDLDSLAQAVNRNIEYLKRLDPGYTFSYGSSKFTSLQVRESQEAFLNLILNTSDLRKLNREIRKNFVVYRAAGRTGGGKVLFTGYYEPVFDASLKEEGPFKYPIYRVPDDLIKIDLSTFNIKYKGETITARIQDDKVLPYFSRRQIEEENALQGKGLEIAWLKDPLDVAFLQIQGSGRLKIEGGDTIPVGYMAANGHAYNSIGRYMIDKGYLTSDEMSMQAIRRYLSSHPEVISDVLNSNPSYVFFRVLDKNSPLGNIQVPLTGGRSIATDASLFPKGALCFITCKKPVIDEAGEIQGWTGCSRFVMNQDTGGAIKGAGRADIFWGNGLYAEAAAGHMKHEGELYILIKKP
jgi:membrane-bound lytic murein transglycosylase A